MPTRHPGEDRARSGLSRLHMHDLAGLQDEERVAGQIAGQTADARDNVLSESVRSKKSYEDEDEDDEVDEDVPDPFWHHPCGRSRPVDLVVRRPKGVSAKRVSRHIYKALERVWQQLNMSVLHYRLQRFDKLYYKVRAALSYISPRLPLT